MRDGGDYQVEYRTRYPDGSYRWRRQQNRVSKVDGDVVLVAGAIIDIHDEKRRVQDLADTAARLALAEQAGGVGLWEIDPVEGTVTYSAGAAALRGLPPAQVTMPIAAAVRSHPPRRSRAFRRRARCARDRATRSAASIASSGPTGRRTGCAARAIRCRWTAASYG